MLNYSFIDPNYSLIEAKEVKNTEVKNELQELIGALTSLENSKERILFLSGFPCRSKLKEYIKKSNLKEPYTAITEQAEKCFIKNKLIAPIPIYFKADYFEIIEALNNKGFYVYWSYNEDDALIVMTKSVKEHFSFIYNNYNGKDIEL